MIEITLSHASPFVRKVRIVAAMKSLASKVAFIDPDKDTARNEALRAANPLQKVPAARLEDGTLIYDSHVICEYLDSVMPSPRLFPAGPERFKTLTLAALADGIMDAAILIVYEGRFRPEEKQHPEWIAKQQVKIDGALDWLETHVPDFPTHPDYGHVSLACALGFLDLRQSGKWRGSHPKLAAWLGTFETAVPSFATTRMPG